MKVSRPATVDGLFLWVLHRFAEELGAGAVLKGGIALRLLESPRSTTDIDFVFVPFESKKAVAVLIERILGDLDDAAVEVRIHSKMVRATVALDEAAIQVEVNVAPACPTTTLITGEFARRQGQPSRVVAVMDFDAALSDKLAAWNERRLVRDLYDGYFLVSRLGSKIDEGRLDARLRKVESRIPRLRGRRRMTREEIARELREALEALTDEGVATELAGQLPPEELVGLAARIRSVLFGLVERL